jgi:hypothetical protein
MIQPPVNIRRQVSTPNGIPAEVYLHVDIATSAAFVYAETQLDDGLSLRAAGKIPPSVKPYFTEGDLQAAEADALANLDRIYLEST